MHSKGKRKMKTLTALSPSLKLIAFHAGKGQIQKTAQSVATQSDFQ